MSKIYLVGGSDLPEESNITRIEDCIMNHLGGVL